MAAVIYDLVLTEPDQFSHVVIDWRPNELHDRTEDEVPVATKERERQQGLEGEGVQILSFRNEVSTEL